MPDPDPPRFYTTEVEAHRSVQEIQDLLADVGSEHQHVVGHYAEPQGIYFTIPHPDSGEDMGVKLEAPVEAVRRRIEASHVTPSDAGDPVDIAWRLLKWTVEVRLEHMRNTESDLLRAFLPDVMTEEGATVYETLRAQPGELLPGANRLLNPSG